MKNYMEPTITIFNFQEDCDVFTDVIRVSEGTSNDNNYSDIDWELG